MSKTGGYFLNGEVEQHFLVASDNKEGQKITYAPFFKYECPKGRLIFETALQKKTKKFVFKAKDRDEIVKKFRGIFNLKTESPVLTGKG